MTGYTWAWIAWVVAFVLIEGAALVRARRGQPGATLSEHLRTWLGTTSRARRWHRIVGSVALVAAVAWFVPHILGG